MSAALPIVERLTRTPANSNRVMPVNPDGPKAARLIEELYEAGAALIADVRARYPGEDLRCPHMMALAAALAKVSGQ